MTFTSSFDLIFAGGGATACITAGRLAAADPSLKILIIEDGPETRDIPAHIQPARCYGNLHNPTSGIFHLHQGRHSEALGRAPVVLSGRCLGGGSCVNLMLYNRAAASDYDDWEKKYNNQGWGSADLIPLLQKAETFHAFHSESVAYHGKNGPLHVSYRKDNINVAEEYLEVVRKYDKERSFTDDINGFYSCNAYGRMPRYINPVTGRRSDTAHHYIYNQIDTNPNLTVVCGKRVTRVIFQDTRAVGVEYMDGPGGQTFVATASRLVVLSAGAFGSATILQRSGIGNTDLLRKCGVNQLVDLPGVGEHYMDHTVAVANFNASDDADTLDALKHGDEEAMKPFVEQWKNTGGGLLAHNGIDVGIKLRPSSDDLRELGQEFRSVWQNIFVPAPDKPIITPSFLAGPIRPGPEEPTKKVLTAFYFIGYPVSMGHVRIASGTNAYAPLDFHPGFLDAPEDLAVLRWGYKKVREILRRMKYYRGERLPGQPVFPKSSAAECKYVDGPVDISAPDIVYSKADNEAIDQYHKAVASSTWHSIGTCAMKPREEGGVVDSRLNVYGTQCLKVADCSIAPGNVAANTYNTAIAIGEKAAVLIAEDLGIQGV